MPLMPNIKRFIEGSSYLMLLVYIIIVSNLKPMLPKMDSENRHLRE